MKVWIIKFHEPIPGENDRLRRTGLIAKILADRGNEVDWFTSAFNHDRKLHRSTAPKTINVEANYRIHLLPSPGYKKNKSLARLRDHHLLGKNLKDALDSQSHKPDLILTAFPTIEALRVAHKFSSQHCIPYIADVRDMWPDIWNFAVPRTLRFITIPVVKLLRYKMRRYLASATAVFSHTDEFLEWALKSARRSKNRNDKVFPFAYENIHLTENEESAGIKFWESAGILDSENSEKTPEVICFFGVLSDAFDFRTVFRAAKKLHQIRPEAKIVLCGKGSIDEQIPAGEKLPPNLFLPGWVDRVAIWSLVRFSKAGLAPYQERVDFSYSIPNKVIEYLASGLPVASSLLGPTEKLIAKHNIGFTYKNGDAEALTAGLLQLLTHEPARSNQSKAAQDLFREKFDADSVYSELATCLEQLSNPDSNTNSTLTLGKAHPNKA